MPFWTCTCKQDAHWNPEGIKLAVDELVSFHIFSFIIRPQNPNRFRGAVRFKAIL